MTPDDEGSIVIPHDDEETRLVRRARHDDKVGGDADDEVVGDVGGDENVDDDDTRMVRRAIDEGDTGSVNGEDDQTRVVDRRPVDETRVVASPVDAIDRAIDRVLDRALVPDGDEESTRLSARGAQAATEAGSDRTQLSRRPRGDRDRDRDRDQLAVSPLVPQSRAGTVIVPPAGMAGNSHPPDTALGSATRYGIRVPEQAAVPIHRVDLSDGHPQTELPAPAEQIRRADGLHARRRSAVAISVIVLATAVVAGAATIAIVVISGL